MILDSGMQEKEETVGGKEEMTTVVLLRNSNGNYPCVTPDSVTWN